MDLLERRGRGVWTAQAETFCRKALLTRHYGEFKFSDMIRVMQHVATKPNGYTHFPTDFDAFALCHKMGFLHTEPSAGPDKNGITYVFASPIHRRYTIIIHKLIVMLIAILELHTGASYQVPTQMQDLITARFCRYA